MINTLIVLALVSANVFPRGWLSQLILFYTQ